MPEIHDNDPLKNLKNGLDSNTTDHTYEFDPEDIRANSTFAAVSYIPILFILPLILKPNSRFARFHANQGVILLIVSVVLGAIQGILSFIPIVSWIVSTVFGLITFGYFLYGFINTLNGKAKELPFVGGIRLIKY